MAGNYHDIKHIVEEKIKGSNAKYSEVVQKIVTFLSMANGDT